MTDIQPSDPTQRQASTGLSQQQLDAMAQRRRARAKQLLDLDADKNVNLSLTNDEAYRALYASRNTEDVGFWEAASTNVTGQDKSLWSQMPFVGMGEEAHDVIQLIDSADRYERGVASKDDLRRVMKFIEWSNRQYTASGIAGAMAGEMIPFMTETMTVLGAGKMPIAVAGKAVAKKKLATLANKLGVGAIAKGMGGLGAATKGTIKKTLPKAVLENRVAQGIAKGVGAGGRVLGKAVPYGVEQTLGKEFISTIANTALSTMGGDTSYQGRIMNATHLDYLQHKYEFDAGAYGLDVIAHDNVSLLEFMPRAAFDQFIENWSEGTGRSLPEGLAALNKALNIKFIDRAIARSTGQGLTGKSKRVFDRIRQLGYDGFVEESLEEVIGASARQLAGEVTGDEEWQQSLNEFFDADNLKGMAMGLAIGAGQARAIAGVAEGAKSAIVGPEAVFQGTLEELARSRRRVEAFAFEEDQSQDTMFNMDEGSFERLMFLWQGEARMQLEAQYQRENPDYDETDPAQFLAANMWVDERLEEEMSRKRQGAAGLTAEDMARELERLENLAREQEAAAGAQQAPGAQQPGAEAPGPDAQAAGTEGLTGPSEEPAAAPSGEGPPPPPGAEGAAPLGAERPQPGGTAPQAEDASLYDEDPQNPGQLDPKAAEETQAWYDGGAEADWDNRPEQLRGAEKVAWSDLTPQQQQLANIAFRNNKSIVFANNVGGPGATVGGRFIVFDATRSNISANTRTLDGRTVLETLSGAQALDAHFLHEAFHRLKRKYGQAWESSLRVMFEAVVPGAYEANRETYRRQAEAAGLELTEEQLNEEGMARTFESLINYFGAISEANDIELMRKLMERGKRGIFRTALEVVEGGLKGLANAVPGVNLKTRSAALKPLREAVSGLDAYGDAEVAFGAAVITDMLEAWRGAGQRLDANEASILGWKQDRAESRAQAEERDRRAADERRRRDEQRQREQQQQEQQQQQRQQEQQRQQRRDRKGKPGRTERQRERKVPETEEELRRYIEKLQGRLKKLLDRARKRGQTEADNDDMKRTREKLRDARKKLNDLIGTQQAAEEPPRPAPQQPAAERPTAPSPPPGFTRGLRGQAEPIAEPAAEAAPASPFEGLRPEDVRDPGMRFVDEEQGKRYVQQRAAAERSVRIDMLADVYPTLDYDMLEGHPQATMAANGAMYLPASVVNQIIEDQKPEFFAGMEEQMVMDMPYGTPETTAEAPRQPEAPAEQPASGYGAWAQHVGYDQDGFEIDEQQAARVRRWFEDQQVTIPGVGTVTMGEATYEEILIHGTPAQVEEFNAMTEDDVLPFEFYEYHDTAVRHAREAADKAEAAPDGAKPNQIPQIDPNTEDVMWNVDEDWDNADMFMESYADYDLSEEDRKEVYGNVGDAAGIGPFDTMRERLVKLARYNETMGGGTVAALPEAWLAPALTGDAEFAQKGELRPSDKAHAKAVAQVVEAALPSGKEIEGSLAYEIDQYHGLMPSVSKYVVSFAEKCARELESPAIPVTFLDKAVSSTISTQAHAENFRAWATRGGAELVRDEGVGGVVDLLFHVTPNRFEAFSAEERKLKPYFFATRSQQYLGGIAEYYIEKKRRSPQRDPLHPEMGEPFGRQQQYLHVMVARSRRTYNQRRLKDRLDVAKQFPRLTGMPRRLLLFNAMTGNMDQAEMYHRMHIGENKVSEKYPPLLGTGEKDVAEFKRIVRYTPSHNRIAPKLEKAIGAETRSMWDDKPDMTNGELREFLDLMRWADIPDHPTLNIDNYENMAVQERSALIYSALLAEYEKEIEEDEGYDALTGEYKEGYRSELINRFLKIAGDQVVRAPQQYNQPGGESMLLGGDVQRQVAETSMSYQVHEMPYMWESMKMAGFDAFDVYEGARRNTAFFNASDLKTIFNNGEFSEDSVMWRNLDNRPIESDIYRGTTKLGVPSGNRGIAISQGVNDPRGIIQKSIHAVAIGSNDERDIYRAHIKMTSRGMRQIDLREVPQTQAGMEQLAHLAMKEGVDHVLFKSKADAERLLENMPKGTIEESGGAFRVKPSLAAMSKDMRYHFGKAKMQRDAIEAVTGERVWQDDDVMFNIDGSAGPAPTEETGRSAPFSYVRYRAMIDKYNADMDAAINEIKRQSVLREDRIKAAMPGGAEGRSARDIAKWVNQMGRAIHLRIDLEEALRDKPGMTIEEYVEEWRAKAAAQGNKWDSTKEQAAKDAIALQGDMLKLMYDMARSNRVMGAALMKAELIGNAREFYTARIWFRDKVELDDRSTVGMGGQIDPTQAGGPFRRGVGGRAKARVFDSILEGWANGRELAIDNALSAAERVHRDGMEALYNTKLRNALLETGAMYDASRKSWKKRPEGYVLLDTNAPGMQNLYVDPSMAKEMKALTRKIDWSQMTAGKQLRAMYRLQSSAKATLLFTSLFHHQAFMRSYLYSVPPEDFNRAVTEDIVPMVKASFMSLWDSEKAMDLLMQSPAARSGMAAAMSSAPDLALGVRAGLTLPLGMQYAQANQHLDDWSSTWVESAVRFAGNKADSDAVRDAANWLAYKRVSSSQWLFSKLGMSLKSQAFLAEYRHELKNNAAALAEGTITEEEIAEIVASKTNDDFGGLNLRRKSQIIGGPRGAGTQLMMRLLFLAPDWTESNFNTVFKIAKAVGEGRNEEARKLEQKAYTNLYMQAVVRSQVPTLLWNMLMAGLDDEETIASMYAKAWDSGKLNIFKADVSLIAQGVNKLGSPIGSFLGYLFGREPAEQPIGGSRAYFSMLGHFMDPVKWATGFLRDDVAGPLKAKLSPGARAMANIVTGRDWKGMSYTNLGIWGDDEKSLMTGHLKKWEFAGRGVSAEQLPSFLIDTAVNNMPIFFGSAIEAASGQEEGFDFLTSAFGFHVTRTYPDKGAGQRAKADFLVGLAD